MQSTISVPPEILQRLDTLAAKLGVTAQYIWSVLLKQAKIEAIQDIISGLLSIGVAYTLYKASFWMWEKASDDNFDNLAWIIGGVISVAGIIIFSIFASVNLYEAITPIVNPEYWALQQIFAVFK